MTDYVTIRIESHSDDGTSRDLVSLRVPLSVEAHDFTEKDLLLGVGEVLIQQAQNL